MSKIRHYRLRLFRVAIILALVVDAHATDINWNSSIGAINYTSSGSPSVIGEGFVFELGAFADDFEPSPANTVEWASHWVALDRNFYNPASGFFSSKAALNSNDQPFHTTKRAHIWGFNLESPGEWILITNTQWLWPSAGGGIQFPVTWSVGAPGTTAIVGEVNGGDFQMMTARIEGSPPPDVNPEAWRQQFFSTVELTNPMVSSWEADPDSDGANNLYELATGTDPRDAGSRPAPVVEVVSLGKGSWELRLRLPRSNRAALDYGAEISTGFVDWSNSETRIVSDSRLEIIFASAVDTPQGRLLMRANFSL